MNKMIKGSTAGAIGVVLLMGGFGTYALWSDSEQLAANSVTSGVLTIDTADGTWDDVRTTGVARDWSADALMVPGDVITYTQSFTVNGTGDNLSGTIKLNALPMSPNGFSSALTRTVNVVDSGPGATDVTKGNATEFSFSAPFDTATLTATVTYTLPSSVSGTDDQNKTATTPASTFTIAQN
jgi:alternate signal-mediated exported protein